MRKSDKVHRNLRIFVASEWAPRNLEKNRGYGRMGAAQLYENREAGAAQL
jgi:hypothetical protein